MSDIDQTTERAFESEIDTRSRETTHLYQHQPTGGHCCQSRREWGKAAGNQVCVDKAHKAIRPQ
jgi:hypothetical protein